MQTEVTRTGTLYGFFQYQDGSYWPVRIEEIDGDCYYLHLDFNEWYSLPASEVGRVTWD